MPTTGTITATSSGAAVAFSTGTDSFRARSVYLYNLTAGNSLLLDLSTTAGASTGFTVPPATLLSFSIGGATGFSVVASSASGSASLSYLATR